MESGDMLKQLLEKFSNETAMIEEEYKLIHEQISELESRLADCEEKKGRVLKDRERVLSMRERYLLGKFERPVVRSSENIETGELTEDSEPESPAIASAAKSKTESPRTVAEPLKKQDRVKASEKVKDTSEPGRGDEKTKVEPEKPVLTAQISSVSARKARKEEASARTRAVTPAEVAVPQTQQVEALSNTNSEMVEPDLPQYQESSIQSHAYTEPALPIQNTEAATPPPLPEEVPQRAYEQELKYSIEPESGHSHSVPAEQVATDSLAYEYQTYESNTFEQVEGPPEPDWQSIEAPEPWAQVQEQDRSQAGQLSADEQVAYSAQEWTEQNMQEEGFPQEAAAYDASETGYAQEQLPLEESSIPEATEVQGTGSEDNTQTQSGVDLGAEESGKDGETVKSINDALRSLFR